MAIIAFPSLFTNNSEPSISNFIFYTEFLKSLYVQQIKTDNISSVLLYPGNKLEFWAYGHGILLILIFSCGAK